MPKWCWPTSWNQRCEVIAGVSEGDAAWHAVERVRLDGSERTDRCACRKTAVMRGVDRVSLPLGDRLGRLVWEKISRDDLTEATFSEYGLQRDNHFILEVLGFKVLGGGDHLSAFDFDCGVMTAAELLQEVLASAFGGGLIATGKDIDGGIAKFGPCVNRQVAFRDHHNAAHSLGKEGMER